MSDPSDKKAPSIPSWQQSQSPSSTSTSTPGSEGSEVDAADAAASQSQLSPQESSSANGKDVKREHLLEQARSFLQDPAVRDEPLERKKMFLRSKGLDEDGVAELLKQNAESDAENGHTEAEISQEAEESWSKAQSSAPSQPQRDIPPIVTYPEFLTQPTKAPPLVTTSRLLSTLYATSAISATAYVLSKFVAGPMAESLTSARHDFAGHTQSKVDTLNDRLRIMVSQDPVEKSGSHTNTQANDGAELEDNGSVDSDPTELFHRDFGTQTSPSLSRRDSSSSVSALDDSAPAGVTVGHEKRLKSLTSHLGELAASADSNQPSSESLSKQIKNLTQYLSDMQYQSPYQFNHGFGVKDPSGIKEDAIEQFRTDIRSVKGVLLSARNFPAGGGSVRLPGRAGK